MKARMPLVTLTAAILVASASSSTRAAMDHGTDDPAREMHQKMGHEKRDHPQGARPQRAGRIQATPLSASTLIIEFNSSAQDIGVQFFLDSEGWTSIEINDPRGKEIFSATTAGRLRRQGGGTELFLESVEPELSELSFEDFFDRFPEGTYRFHGRSTDGGELVGSAEFSHAVPAGPEILTPVQGSTCPTIANPAVISWKPVTTSFFGDPLAIARYEVIVENDDVNFDVHLPASAGTSLTLSPQILPPGAEFAFEVLAIEEGGNQTITEGCFRTAP